MISSNRRRTLHLVIAGVLFTALSTSRAVAQHYPDFEIVESVPVATILDNPDIRNAHEVWLEMIGSAQHTLDIEQFYIANQKGEPLEDVLGAVIAAAGRGVRVRVIVDMRMYKTYPDMVDSLGRIPNIQARTIDFNRIAGGIQHAKYFIVDGDHLFMGSQNFDWRALKHIHELGIRMKNAQAVRWYNDIFELDWALARTPENPQSMVEHHPCPAPIALPEGNDTVYVTTTGSPRQLIPDTLLWDETEIQHLIGSAHDEVCLQFLSYSPADRGGARYNALDDAMRQAAARGVKVKLIVSDWEKASRGEKYLRELSSVPNIEVKYSVIPAWPGGYISFARVEHCKFITADRSAFWLGTSNGEKSYFFASRNVGMIVRNRALTERLHAVFLKSWDGPYTETVTAGGAYEAREHGEKNE